MDTLPFKIPVGIEYTGLIRLERQFVVVEFGKWSWRKMSKQIKEVRIPISELASVEFITGMLETRLDLQLRSMKSTGEIPCNTPGLVKLQFTKRYREAAREMATVLRAAIAEQRLELLEVEMRRLEG